MFQIACLWMCSRFSAHGLPEADAWKAAAGLEGRRVRLAAAQTDLPPPRGGAHARRAAAAAGAEARWLAGGHRRPLAPQRHAGRLAVS